MRVTMSSVASDKQTNRACTELGTLGTIVKNELYTSLTVGHSRHKKAPSDHTILFHEAAGLQAPASTIVSKAWYLFCELLPFTLNVVEARQ